MLAAFLKCLRNLLFLWIGIMVVGSILFIAKDPSLIYSLLNPVYDFGYVAVVPDRWYHQQSQDTAGEYVQSLSHPSAEISRSEYLENARIPMEEVLYVLCDRSFYGDDEQVLP